MKFDTKVYLDRLGLPYPDQVDVDFLSALHELHLLSIPVENLEIFYGSVTPFDIDIVFKKSIARRNRGGYHLQLNFLMFSLLRRLNVKCELHEAKGNTSFFADDYVHSLIICEVNEGKFLMDVGTMDSFRKPIKIQEESVQLDRTTFYKISWDENGYLILEKSSNAVHFESLFKISPNPSPPVSFIDLNDYFQSDPKSSINQEKVIVKNRPDGIVKLSERHFELDAKGSIEEDELTNEEQFLSKLSQYFRIELNDLIQ